MKLEIEKMSDLEIKLETNKLEAKKQGNPELLKQYCKLVGELERRRRERKKAEKEMIEQNLFTPKRDLKIGRQKIKVAQAVEVIGKDIITEGAMFGEAYIVEDDRKRKFIVAKPVFKREFAILKGKND